MRRTERRVADVVNNAVRVARAVLILERRAPGRWVARARAVRVRALVFRANGRRGLELGRVTARAGRDVEIAGGCVGTALEADESGLREGERVAVRIGTARKTRDVLCARVNTSLR